MRNQLPPALCKYFTIFAGPSASEDSYPLVKLTVGNLLERSIELLNTEIIEGTAYSSSSRHHCTVAYYMHQVGSAF
jgi:hypothetical protein